jgi:hypothetical protein
MCDQDELVNKMARGLITYPAAEAVEKLRGSLKAISSIEKPQGTDEHLPLIKEIEKDIAVLVERLADLSSTETEKAKMLQAKTEDDSVKDLVRCS